MSKEAMKLAMEALGQLWLFSDEAAVIANPAITALREALAEQPAQVDPCPGCLKGRVCRTPKCGRLKLPADHPLRSEQPAQQEPVAWGIIASNTGRICQVELDADEIEGHNPKYIVPLYTSPPPCPTCEALARTVMLDQTSHDAQRQWVGLTEEEHTQIAINCGCMSADWVFYGAAVERNLKEKNT